MVTTECSRAVVWPDSDDNDDAAENGGSTAERAQPDSADSERGRTLTLGVSRRGMKRAVQLIWGNRVGQHMGVARYGRVRPEVFDQRSSLNPPTNIAAMHSSDKSKFVDACKVRCEKLPTDVIVNWHKLDLNKDMNDVGYVVGQTLMFIQSGHDAKLGVTTCPAWRTFFCEDHNASFEAYHFMGFEFHALIVEKGKRAAYVEKAAIAAARSSTHSASSHGKLLNKNPGGDGPIRDNNAYVCYLVVRPRA